MKFGSYSKNYYLKKPAKDDDALIEDINYNSDLLDRVLTSLSVDINSKVDSTNPRFFGNNILAQIKKDKFFNLDAFSNIATIQDIDELHRLYEIVQVDKLSLSEDVVKYGKIFITKINDNYVECIWNGKEYIDIYTGNIILKVDDDVEEPTPVAYLWCIDGIFYENTVDLYLYVNDVKTLQVYLKYSDDSLVNITNELDIFTENENLISITSSGDSKNVTAIADGNAYISFASVIPNLIISNIHFIIEKQLTFVRYEWVLNNIIDNTIRVGDSFQVAVNAIYQDTYGDFKSSLLNPSQYTIKSNNTTVLQVSKLNEGYKLNALKDGIISISVEILDKNLESAHDGGLLSQTIIINTLPIKIKEIYWYNLENLPNHTLWNREFAVLAKCDNDSNVDITDNIKINISNTNIIKNYVYNEKHYLTANNNSMGECIISLSPIDTIDNKYIMVNNITYEIANDCKNNCDDIHISITSKLYNDGVTNGLELLVSMDQETWSTSVHKFGTIYHDMIMYYKIVGKFTDGYNRELTKYFSLMNAGGSVATFEHDNNTDPATITFDRGYVGQINFNGVYHDYHGVSYKTNNVDFIVVEREPVKDMIKKIEYAITPITYQVGDTIEYNKTYDNLNNFIFIDNDGYEKDVATIEVYAIHDDRVKELISPAFYSMIQLTFDESKIITSNDEVLTFIKSDNKYIIKGNKEGLIKVQFEFSDKLNIDSNTELPDKISISSLQNTIYFRFRDGNKTPISTLDLFENDITNMYLHYYRSDNDSFALISDFHDLYDTNRLLNISNDHETEYLISRIISKHGTTELTLNTPVISAEYIEIPKLTVNSYKLVGTKYEFRCNGNIVDIDNYIPHKEDVLELKILNEYNDEKYVNVTENYMVTSDNLTCTYDNDDKKYTIESFISSDTPQISILDNNTNITETIIFNKVIDESNVERYSFMVNDVTYYLEPNNVEEYKEDDGKDIESGYDKYKYLHNVHFNSNERILTIAGGFDRRFKIYTNNANCTVLDTTQKYSEDSIDVYFLKQYSDDYMELQTNDIENTGRYPVYINENNQITTTVTDSILFTIEILGKPDNGLFLFNSDGVDTPWSIIDEYSGPYSLEVTDRSVGFILKPKNTENNIFIYRNENDVCNLETMTKILALYGYYWVITDPLFEDEYVEHTKYLSTLQILDESNLEEGYKSFMEVGRFEHTIKLTGLQSEKIGACGYIIIKGE